MSQKKSTKRFPIRFKDTTITIWILFIVITGGVIYVIATTDFTTRSLHTLSYEDTYVETDLYTFGVDVPVSVTYPAVQDAILVMLQPYADEFLSFFKQEQNSTLVNEQKYIFAAAPQMIESDIATTVVYTISAYTGGVHPIYDVRTITFTREGQLIKLSDLYTDEELVTVSDRVRSELIASLGGFADMTWIQEGTRPEAEYFKRFYIENDSITFIFPPYAVAPYAAGSQEVTIPFEPGVPLSSDAML